MADKIIWGICATNFYDISYSLSINLYLFYYIWKHKDVVHFTAVFILWQVQIGQ